ncbi:hypothetical protein MMC13_007274 [Lambiella insularis]|nr:hypothetical protein [Lambiella insularis]
MSSITLTFLVLILTALTEVRAFWRMECGIIQTGRIDPIVSPGKLSGHAHKIAGASNLGLNSTYNSIREASCTSCELAADKSNYWTPQLYYQHSNGSFEEVPNSGMVVYYLGRGDNRTNIQPFPPGFRMLSGAAGARSYNNASLTFGGTQGVTYVGGTIGNGTLNGGSWINGTKYPLQTYYGRPIADRVSFACLAEKPEAETSHIVNTDCANGLRAQIHFQTCWDGINLYKSDNSHVAYMSDMDDGVCPPGYPVQFVHLFFEVLYGVNQINKDGGQFVFAQGDPTGYGFHGDFLNGWDVDTLASALTGGIENCANTDNAGQISACPALLAVDGNEFSYNCPEQPALVNEPVHGMLSKLPGCITITPGPGEATSAQMSCPANATLPSINVSPTSSKVYTSFLPTVGSVNNKWTYLGCANETASGKNLAGATYSSKTNMTNEACQSFCASHNFPIAATEYGVECYCGLRLDPTTSLGQNCKFSSMVCSGNSSELCGGPNLLNVFNSTTYSGPLVSFPNVIGAPLGTSKYLGCFKDNNPWRQLAQASFTSSTSMTLDSCMSFCAAKGYPLFGTEYTSECYCGSTLSATANLTTSSSCNQFCNGNSTQLCGGPNLLTIFNNTAIKAIASPSPSPVVSSTTLKTQAASSSTASPVPTIAVGTVVGTSVYLGCASEATSGRALNATGYTNSSVTNDQCATFCASQNYALFGTEFSSECFCGNALAAGAKLSQTGCTVPCAGTHSPKSLFASHPNVCGGANRLSLWNNTAYKPVQTVAAVGSYVSQGCYAEGKSARALASAGYSNSSVTVESCVAFCQGKKYKWAGVEYAQECYCGTGISNGGAPASGGCDMACVGNRYESCGGTGHLNVYKSSWGVREGGCGRVRRAWGMMLGYDIGRVEIFSLWDYFLVGSGLSGFIVG